MYLLSSSWTQQLLRNVVRDAAALAWPHDKGTPCIFKACCPFYFPLSLFLPVFPFVSENTDLRIYHARLCPTVVPFVYHFIFCKYKTAPDMQVIHCEGLNWILLRSMWCLWWTNWYWDRFSSECLSFSLSESFRQCSLFIHSSITGATQTKQFGILINNTHLQIHYQRVLCVSTNIGPPISSNFYTF